MASVNGSLVTDAVVALLRSELGVKVGDAVAPQPSSTDLRLELRAGYLTVQRTVAGSPYQGSEIGGQPESIELIRYLINAAGIQRNQAERLLAAAVGVLVDRDDDAGSRAYVHTLAVAGHVVLSRRSAGVMPTESLGTIQAGGFVDLLVSVV